VTRLLVAALVAISDGKLQITGQQGGGVLRNSSRAAFGEPRSVALLAA
jgi:hypothetical protein